MLQSFNNKSTAQKAFTLIEAVIYGALLTVITVVVVGGLLRLGTGYARIQNTRKVNEVGAFALDQIARKARGASTITAVSGTGENPDTITLGTKVEFAELVRKDGAVSHWDFEESEGSVLYDRIGNNHGEIIDEGDGIPDNENKQRTAVVGKGYYFDKINDYIELPKDIFLSHNEGAIEVIIKAEGTDQKEIFNAFTVNPDMPIDDVTFRGLYFGILNGTVVAFNASRPNWELKKSFKINVENAWHHVVMEGEGDIIINGKTRAYIDGVEDSTTDSEGQIGEKYWFNDYLGYPRRQIGGSKSANGSFKFEGIIDEVVIYDEAKGADVWAAHYDAAFNNIVEGERRIEVSEGALKIVDPNEELQEQILTTDVKVTNLNAVNVGGDPEVVRLELTVEAGNGSARVERTFVQTINTRTVEE